jgi:Mrp family chromosome partitioning ATPase
VLAISDARLIAPEVDIVLMVAAAGRTRAGTLRSSLQHLHMVHSNVAGVVLNRARDKSDAYGTYGAYGDPYSRVHEPAEPIADQSVSNPAH